MSNRYNKLLNSNSSTIFLFLYGVIIQIVSFPVIYYYGVLFPETTKLVDKLIFIWFLIPMISVFSIIIATMQIKERKRNYEKWKKPLIGLILNFTWLICYLLIICFAFVIKSPMNYFDFSFLR